MAYNRKNLLKRIIEIQEIYLCYQAKGHNGTWIFNNLIADNYHITRRTLSNYLALNAKRELRHLSTDNEFEITLSQARDKAQQDVMEQ